MRRVPGRVFSPRPQGWISLRWALCWPPAWSRSPSWARIRSTSDKNYEIPPLPTNAWRTQEQVGTLGDTASPLGLVRAQETAVPPAY